MPDKAWLIEPRDRQVHSPNHISKTVNDTASSARPSWNRHIRTSQRKVRNMVHLGPPSWTKSRTFQIRFAVAV